ncbi:MAG: phosphotransferase [Tuberibacillus sp.]
MNIQRELSEIVGDEIGLIDWGRGGIADRHQDLAIMIRSLRHNMGERSVQSFIDTYGRNRIDFNKIDYYIMLDELF